MNSKPAQFKDRASEFDELRNIIVGVDKYAHEEDFNEFREEVFARLKVLEKKMEDKIVFESKLVDSKGKMVDVISPQMGKIIRASVVLQIEAVNAKIKNTSSQFKNMFGLGSLFNKITGKQEVEVFVDYPKIIQLFIIEKDTGLLIGKFEKERIADPDLMTGILTSVKAFAESSLDLDDAEIGMIDYGAHFIKMFNYGTYYFALVLTGTQNNDFETFIAEEIDGFASMHMDYLIDSDRVNKNFDIQINRYFENTCEKLEKK